MEMKSINIIACVVALTVFCALAEPFRILDVLMNNSEMPEKKVCQRVIPFWPDWCPREYSLMDPKPRIQLDNDESFNMIDSNF